MINFYTQEEVSTVSLLATFLMKKTRLYGLRARTKLNEYCELPANENKNETHNSTKLSSIFFHRLES